MKTPEREIMLNKLSYKGIIEELGFDEIKLEGT